MLKTRQYSKNNYTAFGSVMAGRSFTNANYRFKWNGKEAEPELFEGCLTFEARIFDNRICRWLSTDPREGEYAWQSTYVYFSNSPISIIDFLGMGSINGDRASKKGEQGVVSAGWGLMKFVQEYSVSGKNNFEKLDKLMMANLTTFAKYPTNGSKDAKLAYINEASKNLKAGQKLSLPKGTQVNDYEYRDMTGTASGGGTRSDNGKNEVVANKPVSVDNAQYTKQSIGTKIGNAISKFDNSLEGHGDPCQTGAGVARPDAITFDGGFGAAIGSTGEGSLSTTGKNHYFNSSLGSGYELGYGTFAGFTMHYITKGSHSSINNAICGPAGYLSFTLGPITYVYSADITKLNNKLILGTQSTSHSFYIGKPGLGTSSGISNTIKLNR